MSSHRDPELDSPGTFSIKADRLILRDFAPDDLPAVHAFRSDPETIPFMSDQPEPATLAQSSEWLDGAIRYNALRPREGYNLAIATKTPDRVIGWIGFGNSSRHPGPEHFGVGYMLLSTEWGKGYATEALTAAIAFMTDTLGGDSVWAWCFAANGASERVMQKAGMRFAREFADEETGEPCREYVYERPRSRS